MMVRNVLTFVCCQVLAFFVFSFFLLNVTAELPHRNSVRLTPNSIDAVIGEVYNLSINKSIEYVLEFSNTTGVSSSTPAHITVTSNDAHSNHPVLIVLRQARGVLSWQIPFIVGNSVYRKTSRILCPDVNYYCAQNVTAAKLKDMFEEDNSFYVSISSSSPNNITVILEVITLDNFTVNASTEYQVPANNSLFQFTPSQPWYYQFRWLENSIDGNITGNEMKSVVVKVHSHDDICMTMSIQNLSCPVLDLERTVGYEGFRQTLDRKGGVTLTKEQFPVGFHIVFVVNQDDKKCFYEGYSSAYIGDSETRSKTIRFEISETISFQTFVIALMTPVVVIVSVYVLFLIAAIVCGCRPFGAPRPDGRMAEPAEPSSGMLNTKVEAPITKNIKSKDDAPNYQEITMKISTQNTRKRGKDCVVHCTPALLSDDVSLDETIYDAQINDYQENVLRTGRPLCLSDLSRKHPRVLRWKSNLYALNLITVAVFYALPVFQLMYSLQSTLQKTGNQDTCFYNFLCAYPYRLTATIVIGDFNHVFSNIGYIALGILFILWTSRRDALHQIEVSRRQIVDTELGIPQHYGLFYALGIALVMEGFLSGMYHICPNETNFQFDTSFMYVIAVLCMIKLYQNRHPDVNASAYSTFLILAFMILIGMLGIMENSDKFFVIFTVVHVVMCLWVSIQVYGIKPNSIVIFRVWSEESRQELRNHPLRVFTPRYPNRLGLLIVGNFANWTLVYLAERFELKRNFGSYLLTILLTNLVLYFLFYIVMKLFCKEKVFLEPLMYFIIGTVLWGFAGVFFFSRMTSWATTPAESRHKNEVCNFLQFYDNHDIWHFLSAASMFCTFMVLLTLDDDLVEVPRKKISVF